MRREFKMAEDRIKQTYTALTIAGARIGANNYKLQAIKWKKSHKSMKNFKFTVTPEHKEIVDALPKVLDGTMSPEDAMALLWQHDTMKQRGI